MKKLQSLAALATCLLSGIASASLIFDSTVMLSAQGFGTAPRDLTVQGGGMMATTESGCVAVNAMGQITIGAGSCTAEGSVFKPNGVQNIGGSETPPLDDNQKFGIPSLASLGIPAGEANDIGILFNGTEPAGNRANVTDITLNFFSPTGVLLGAIDGSFDFLNSFQGNGSAGFIFRISGPADGDDQLTFVNALIAANPNAILSLNASLTNIAGGPDSFRLGPVHTNAAHRR
ncbi:MAG: hypothetical protein WKH97_18675 [Casimicrobiaceae bacterium]